MPAHELEAALLHDTMEDTSAMAVDLQAVGVNPEAITTVEWVTKNGPHVPPGMPYLRWIWGIGA